MKTILLTGASGFIGQFVVCSLLAKNYVVHAVTSKSPRFKTLDNLFWHQTNLLDSTETEILMKKLRPTHLLHLAWYVEHGKFWNAAENLDWLQASLNLAKTFAVNGGERLVIAGTCAEYDWMAERSPFAEYKTSTHSRSLYGSSKNALGSVLENFAEVYDFSFASGRIFFPFGADEPTNRLIPSVICSLLKNKPAETSHGNQIRDFLYVEEIADAFVALLESDVRGAVNVASGKGISLREIIEEIAEIIGKPELLRIGAIDSPQNEPLEIVADVKRLNDEVGWRREYNIKSRLRETVTYWKEKYENTQYLDN